MEAVEMAKLGRGGNYGCILKVELAGFAEELEEGTKELSSAGVRVREG